MIIKLAQFESELEKDASYEARGAESIGKALTNLLEAGTNPDDAIAAIKGHKYYKAATEAARKTGRTAAKAGLGIVGEGSKTGLNLLGRAGAAKDWVKGNKGLAALGILGAAGGGLAYKNRKK